MTATWTTRCLPAAVGLAGCLHVGAAVSHLSAVALHAAAFAALAGGQLWLAAHLWRAQARVEQPPARLLRVTCAVSLWVALLWVLTRTTGVALVTGRAGIGLPDLLATALELVAAALSLRLLDGRGPTSPGLTQREHGHSPGLDAGADHS